MASSPAGSDRAARRLAWVLWIVAVGMAVAALVVDWQHGRADLAVAVAATVSLAIPVPTVGVLVLARHPRHAVGWSLWAFGFVLALDDFRGAYARYGGGSLPGADALATVGEAVYAPDIAMILLFVLLPLLFPTGHPPAPSWRPVVWLAVAGLVVVPTAGAAGLWVARSRAARGEPAAIPLPLELAYWIPTVIVVLGGGVAALASLVVRFRAAGGAERQQLKWFVYGALLCLLLVVSFMATPLARYDAVLMYGYLSLPIAIGAAMLRYRLYDIDFLINRTLVYGALTVIVVGVYVLVVGFLGAAVQRRGDLVPSLIATGLVAVLFQPLRNRLQRAVNRLTYGDRDEPYRALSRLSQRLGATLAPDQTLPAVVQTVQDALRLPYAAIALRGEDGSFSVAAATGRPGPSPVRLPLVYQGETVGELLLGPRPGESTLTPADRRLVQDLARQAGVAAHAVRLTVDLQRARERLVSAREEERRRLHHDLHDGLGPALASMSLQLAALRNLIAHDSAAVAILGDVKAQLHDAIADVRRVVYALRPPTLDELGLVGAIREHAARLSQGDPSVAVEASEPLPPLPAAVEVAAYRIALEALTNVARHAGARTCVVRLSVEAADSGGARAAGTPDPAPSCRLRLEVIDDGRGVRPDDRAGTGRISMRERAAELGGTLDVGPATGGGTAVVARLPLAVAPT